MWGHSSQRGTRAKSYERLLREGSVPHRTPGARMFNSSVSPRGAGGAA